MKPVLGSDHPNRVSKGRLLLEEVDHLYDTVFCRRLCKVQLPVWVAEFTQCCRRLGGSGFSI